MQTLTSTMQNAKTTCIATLALVFVCGGLVGAVLMSVVGHRYHLAPFWTPPGKAAVLQRMEKELDLTTAQTEELNTILDDFSKYYATVLSDGRARIFQILNEGQKRKFEKILAEAPRP